MTVERNFRNYLSTISTLSLIKAVAGAIPIAILVVAANSYFSSREIFKTRLNSAVNIFRTDILAGELKRSQLLLTEVLGPPGYTSVEILDQNNRLRFPDQTAEDKDLGLISINTSIPVFFDEEKTILFGYVVGKQKLEMPWMLFLTTVFAIFFSQIMTMLLLKNAVNEIGTDLAGKIGSIGKRKSATGISDFDKISSFIDDLEQQITLISSTYKSPEELRRFAHDIRSPLSAISLALRSIGDLPPPTRRVVDNAFLRMSSMTSSLLTESHANKTSLIQSMEKVLEEKKLISSIEWEASFNGDIQIPSSLDTEIQRLFSNLLDNAVQASNFTGKIHILARADSEEFLLSIIDRGPGIPTHLRDTALAGGFTTKPDGHGIGLSSAKRFVEELGGTLALNDLPDGRFAIDIRIPRSALSPSSIR